MRRWWRSAQNLELLTGVVGAFTFFAAVNAVVLEVQGRPALGAAAVLLVCLLLLYVCWQAWQSARKREAPRPGRRNRR